MEMPPYFLTRPPADADAATAASFQALYAAQVVGGDGGQVVYALPAPKWQFLCWLTETHDILLHGSGNGGIDEFEPRKSNDVEEFGNRSAVYAASDGVWPIFYAVMDRDGYPMSLNNGCFRAAGDGSDLVGPFYFFSISLDALRHRPWRRGFVYVLPRETFERQPLRAGGEDFYVAQWAGLVPVRPLARIATGPEDFPFLGQIRGHDDAVVWKRAAAEPGGFPWLDKEGH